MFTGIVEEIGTIERVISGAGSGEIAIRAKTVLAGTRLGDSIAVNGVCLTVTRLTDTGFTADVMPETLRRSNLGGLGRGAPVNLERAMAADGRFGGHIVSGHIDGVGAIAARRSEGNAVWITVSAPSELLRLIVEKGSIAIDGISLTVAALTETTFSVSVIPHTGAETTLLGRRTGELVNLETDLIGKYVQRLMQPQQARESRLSEAFLREYGF
ncbi:MAG: riboflavin synthase [Oscillospiraceae bacterium]|nr:riboflavin synthase [Oscillospiraceae bacterium]